MSTVTLRAAEPNDSTAWDDFVSSLPDAPLFHMKEFLTYHPANRFETRNLVVERYGAIRGVLPLAMRQQDGRRIAVSPYGASFGGFATAADDAVEWLPTVMNQLQEQLHSQNAAALHVTLPPECYGSMTALQEMHLAKRGACVIASDVVHMLSLAPEEASLWDGFAGRTRTAIRKADKSGLDYQPHADIGAAWDLVAANKRLHDNATPTHSRDELSELARRFPERVFADTATLGGNPIAAIVYFQTTPQVRMTFYIAGLPEHRTTNAVSWLLWHGVRAARLAGNRWFDFGTTSVKMELRDNLAFFKSSFGAGYVSRRTWEWTL